MRPVAITTSQRPARRTRSLCRDLECALPDATYVPRGTKNFRDTVLEALDSGAKVLFYVTEARGNPAQLHIIDLKDIPPRMRLSFRLGGVKLQRELLGNRVNTSGDLAITTSKRPVSGHVKVAELLSEVLGVDFVPRVGSLKNVLEEASADVLLVVESHPRHLGTLTFYRSTEKVGPSLFYRNFRTKDERMEL
ncbi:hypothetical protein [Methanopyrus sp.]